jgi:hypothetical protein
MTMMDADAGQPRGVGQLVAEEAGDGTREPAFQGHREALRPISVALIAEASKTLQEYRLKRVQLDSDSHNGALC